MLHFGLGKKAAAIIKIINPTTNSVVSMNLGTIATKYKSAMQ